MLKAILDTNIWISGLLLSSLTKPIVDAHAERKFLPIVSPDTIKELNQTLKKPRIRKLIAEDKAAEFLKFLDGASRLMEPSISLKVCRDPDDDAFISLAASAKIPLVSLDKDVLVLRGQIDVEILHPKEFIKRLG